ncbi:MAG: caspase family protein [Candidatus Obscuribacterales bacterium]|nr:caspase family protein [Candidatus Obscuribacterales bacterium]
MTNPNDDERARNAALAPNTGSELPDWMLNEEQAGAAQPPEWLSDFPQDLQESPTPRRTQPPPIRRKNGQQSASLPPATRSSTPPAGTYSQLPPQYYSLPSTGDQNSADPYGPPSGTYSQLPQDYYPAPPPPPPPRRRAANNSSTQNTRDVSILIPIGILSFVFLLVVFAGIAGFVNGTDPYQSSGATANGSGSLFSAGSGQQYFNEGNYGKAVEELTKEIAANQANAQLYFLRAVSYARLKNFTLAEADASRSVNLAPQNTDYLLQRADIYGELKQFRKALADMNLAMKLKQPDVNNYIYRSYLFSCMHSPKSALADANKAVSLAPNESTAHEQKAGVLYSSNQYKAAIASYTTALSLKPAEPDRIYAMRAWCYFSLKDNGHALADAKKALQLDPNNAQARDVISNLPSSYQAQVAINVPSVDATYTPPMQSHTAPATGSGYAPVADKWALVVGLGKFQDSRSLNPLKSAKDAKDLCNYLTTEANFAPDHVRMLVNEHATLKRVKSELNKFLAHVARPDDLVVIYFSSHGSSGASDVRGDNYICLYDTQCDDLFSTALEMQSLINVVKNRIISRRILLVLDCCFAGNTSAKAFGKTGNFDAAQIAQGTGQVVLCSSAPNQMSCESVRYQNGVFTRQFINGMRSQGTMTTIDDAFRYTRNAVANEVREDSGLSQTPVMNGAWKGPKMRLALPPAAPRPIPASVAYSLEPDDSSN